MSLRRYLCLELVNEGAGVSYNLQLPVPNHSDCRLDARALESICNIVL